MEDEESQRKPLLAKARTADLRIKPKRSIVVEPLLVLYFLSGMPIADIKTQYMYSRIAEDLHVNLNNMTGKALTLTGHRTQCESHARFVFNTGDVLEPSRRDPVLITYVHPANATLMKK